MFTTSPVDLTETLNRFERNAHLRMFFAGSDDDRINGSPKLYLPSTWTPARDRIPIEYRARINDFIAATKALYRRKKVLSNLTDFQQCTLRNLQESEDFIVFPADKNLGPVILERSTYTKRVLHDHLGDGTTYRQLSAIDATEGVNSCARQVEAFITAHTKRNKEGGIGLTSEDETYLERSMNVKDRFSYFYITAKIHKTPWKTRPIVSAAGSILHSLGC